jgi:hypothetical protein
VLFEGKEKVIFDVEDLSKVSFMNTDMTVVDLVIRQDWEKEEKRKLKKIDSR